MRMINSMIVDKSAALTWALIGDDFVDVAKWMAAIPKSEPILTGTPLKGAPAVGRNSYLIAKFNGMYQQETITQYNDSMKTVTINAILKKTPKIMPLKGYESTVTVEHVSDTSCRVTWDATAHLNTLGYIIPGLKKSLNAGFIRNLEEIKHYMETGEPHPRKVEKVKSELAYASAHA
ncbi:MAG: SRPBCC family protein [Rhizobiales bacterium]|nr:SRPBCC family protein [Hyphomicrobiales bacterium]